MIIMAIELGINGLPQCGRARATLDEIQARFVDHTDFAESGTRTKIWSDFSRASRMLNSTIPICATWVGGSFITTKLEPSDIDVLYIVAAQDYAQLQGEEALKRVSIFSKNGQLMERGIRVDSSILVWNPIPEPQPDNPSHANYLKWRGYWDDFLQRHTEDKTKTPTGINSIPTRGYLEVIGNDFVA